MTVERVRMYDAVFVRARVPVALERSLRLALGRVYAPFFSLREQDALVVVLREDEWARVAGRFPTAQVEQGLHLVSIAPPHNDTALASRLVQTLAAGGIAATALPSFYYIHLVVSADKAERCVAAVRQLMTSPQQSPRRHGDL